VTELRSRISYRVWPVIACIASKQMRIRPVEAVDASKRKALHQDRVSAPIDHIDAHFAELARAVCRQIDRRGIDVKYRSMVCVRA